MIPESTTLTHLRIRSSIERGKLHLTRGQRLNHFFPAFIALLIGLLLPLLMLGDWVVDRRVDSPLSWYGTSLFSAPWLIGGVLLHRHLQKVLTLIKVPTQIALPEARELLVKLADREGWSVQNNRKTYMVFKTHPGFTWNWGEMITVLFHSDEVWINSICDPDSQPAFYSSGRNARNIQLVQEFLSGYRQPFS